MEFPLTPTRRRLSTTLSKKSTIRGYIKSFDGTKLFYSLEGKGRPLVFCYGLVCSSLHWSRQVEYFSNAYQTLWFDYRGHQNSETPKDPKSLTLDSIAEDMKAVLDELGLKKVVFLGHSMGVNGVLEFYRRYPNRVSAMVLANGTAQRPLETLLGHNVFQKVFKALSIANERSPKLISWLWKAQKMNPFLKTLVAKGGFNVHLTPQSDINLYTEQLMKMDTSVLFHLLENYDSYDANPWLHSIDIPTLILAGEEDRLIPVDQQKKMHQLIPNSRLEVIRHGSHCPQLDLPDLVNLRIEKFLAEMEY